LIKLIKKKIEENPRRWHEVLSKALCAHRISRHGATKITPFELVYGQEAVLPVEEIEKDKARVTKAYNKKVKSKSFQVGELVWKTILPIRSKSNQFGKWSPNWEGPYKVIKVTHGNSYLLETLQGQRLKIAFNGRYLKKYFPSVW
jgi:hypothetical protein